MGRQIVVISPSTSVNMRGKRVEVRRIALYTHEQFCSAAAA